MPLTCYFSDLRFEKDAFVTPYVNDKCTNVSERVLNEISLDNEITIAASFNISLTIFLSTGCYFNKRTQQDGILSGDGKRMFLCLARCIKPLHKIKVM